MDEVRLIEVKQDIHADNERIANDLRERLVEKKTFLLNLMSSPGAGKTSTILRTIEELRGQGERDRRMRYRNALIVKTLKYILILV